MTDATRNHKFTGRTKVSTGEPMCDVCGLVWKSDQLHPPITCPKQPLGLVNIEWVERYT